MTAADQPTTEMSARTVLAPWLGTGVVAADAVRALDDAGLLTPTPQPAADTETEVQWGVRLSTGRVIEEPTEDHAYYDSIDTRNAGAVMVHRTITRTPWEEA